MINKNFNIILAGVGGQGIITLLSIIDQAAFLAGYKVRSSELHGLSQRGGAVKAYVRFGKEVYSPLIPFGEADLIIALEVTEGLRCLQESGPQSRVLINEYFLPIYESDFSKESAIELLKKTNKNIELVPASKICLDNLQNEVFCTLYLLGYAVYKKMIPLKEKFVLQAIDQVIPEKYLELNKKAFLLAKNDK